MAKQETDSRKSLVIVESPTKAKTISKLLGKDFIVEASIGHIRDLPTGKKDCPEKFKSEPWSYLGVDVDNGFKPVYIVPSEKKAQVQKLKSLLKEAKDVYLATDEDREGEAISWHLTEALEPKVPVYRMVFHEITNEAIHAALNSPRNIHEGLVRAQETRRILDRLYGYDVSKLLWRRVAPGLSAGRVQSVAVRLIVDRERQRIAFRSATYWDLLAEFETGKKARFKAELRSVDGKRIPAGKDFDSTTGKLKSDDFVQLNEADARALAERLRNASFKVIEVKETPYRRRPQPPFTTSTLQQEANRKLGMTARRAMRTAQSLYENGHITYMRTDSTNLAKVAVDAARDLVKAEYGAEFLPEQPRTYASKVKNAQEAHEAIRPAGHPFELPQNLRSRLSDDEYRLFEMIWKRTIASQMEDARGTQIAVVIEGDGAIFQATGKTIEFPGFLRAYVEGSDDPDAELADNERILPAVAPQEPLTPVGVDSLSHTTQPPARFTEAALTKELETLGIGRPSTYASIIDTIQQREYVNKKGSALVPSWTAFVVTRLMEQHFGELVDYEFTAQMEEFLDAVSRREAGHEEYLRAFYFGDGKPGLKERLELKLEEIDPRSANQIDVGIPTEGDFRDPIYLRVGKFGPFLEQGERKASLPAELAPDELTIEKCLELLAQAEKGDEPLGVDPATGKPVFLKQGRFGPYVQLGTLDDAEKPKNASLLKGMAVETLTLDDALSLLSLPRTLGPHPETGQPIEAHNGKFGPYVKAGTDSRSLPADTSPLHVTLEQAIALFAQPKRGRGQAAPAAPLKAFDQVSPVTGTPIQILSGRYGPYVTDGTTHFSVPKDVEPQEVTAEQAVQWLAEKAARAPVKKKASRKKTAKKAASEKSSPAKKAAKKSSGKKAAKKAASPAADES
ncbi:MAG TPA: type I DNA topoisomerase [Pirellulaceae bacterium]|jgi:DNA topoisomerase-1|nr:type I DNA topoisomerase [Pirellulaceae bacterium]